MKTFFHDSYQIARSKDGLPRWSLLYDYVRLRVKSSLGLARLRIPALGFSLRVLSHEMGLHLYREIAIAQVYYFSFSGASPLIIDCGSNVGMSVLFFKKLYPKCRIIAVEPDPSAFRVLEANVHDNQWNDVALHNAAVTGDEGLIPLYVNDENPGDLGTSLIAQGHLPRQVMVRALRLSNLLKDERIDFLKLDIEGAEADVIDELNGCGGLRRINQMVIEYHHHIAGKADCLSHVLAVLEQNGFGYQLKCLDFNFRVRAGFQVVWIYAYNPLVAMESS